MRVRAAVAACAHTLALGNDKTPRLCGHRVPPEQPRASPGGLDALKLFGLDAPHLLTAVGTVAKRKKTRREIDRKNR